MAGFNSIKVTSQGMKLLTKVLAGATLLFTEVVVGDGYMPDGTDETQRTSLVSPVEADIGITGISSYNNGTVNLKARLTSGESSFFLREIGIMAQINDETPVLYAYANAGDYPDFIPSTTKGSEVIQDINLITIIGQAESVKANVTVTAGVNSAEFNKHRTDKVIDHPNGSVTAAKLAADVYDIFDTKLEKYIVDALPEATKSYTFEDGEVAFKAVERCTLSTKAGNLTMTTSTNAGNKYALAQLDFSDMVQNASKLIVDMDVKIPTESRWYIAFADLAKRPGTSDKSGYDKTGTAFYCGTQYAKMLYVNGVYKFGENVFDVWVHLSANIDIAGKKVTYTFSDIDSGSVIGTETVSFADADTNKVSCIELYSWASGCVIDVDNVDIKVHYIAKGNALYFVSVDSTYTKFDTYIYANDEFVCVAQAVPVIGSNSIGASHLKNGCVTNSKLASGSVTIDKFIDVSSGAYGFEDLGSICSFSGDRYGYDTDKNGNKFLSCVIDERAQYNNVNQYKFQNGKIYRRSISMEPLIDAATDKEKLMFGDWETDVLPASSTPYDTGRKWIDGQAIYRVDFSLFIAYGSGTWEFGYIPSNDITAIKKVADEINTVIDCKAVQNFVTKNDTGNYDGDSFYAKTLNTISGGWSLSIDGVAEGDCDGVIVNGYYEYVKNAVSNSSVQTF